MIQKLRHQLSVKLTAYKILSLLFLEENFHLLFNKNCNFDFFLNDISDIVLLWEELMEFHAEMNPIFKRSNKGKKVFKKNLLRQLMNKNKALLLSAVKDNKVIGYSFSYIDDFNPPYYEVEKIGFFADVIVTEQYRKYGIGKRLVDRTIQWFAEKGISRLEAGVLENNDIGNKFWRNMKFNNFVSKLSKNI